MCQNSTDSQKPLSGAWAKVHGQGTAQLQLSNQSPTICQLGKSLIWALRSDRRRRIIAGLAALWAVKRPITAGPAPIRISTSTSFSGRKSAADRVGGPKSAHRGGCPFGALHLILEDWLSPCRVQPLPTGQTPTGQTPTGWGDQIAVAAQMRTYDEATQPCQSRHAGRTQGLRLQPFLPILMGDRHSGEARLRFRLHRWRAWAVWPRPARGPLPDRRTP